MTILLSNDDGYKAEGLNILDNVLSDMGHEVYVAAPDSEQSGKSHSMSITGRIKAREYRKNRFHLAGTPADCIIFTHKAELFPSSPDLVISGINHGYNLSGDVIYSGTCAAARQAALYGIPAIALSASHNADKALFERISRFVAENLDRFSKAIVPDTFMNINFPSAFSGEWALADMGYTEYGDEVDVVGEDEGFMHLEITGFGVKRQDLGRRLPPDFAVCRSGKASISIIECLPALNLDAMDRL